MPLHPILHILLISTNLFTGIYWISTDPKEGTLRESQRQEGEVPVPQRLYNPVGMTEYENSNVRMWHNWSKYQLKRKQGVLAAQGHK